MLKRIIYDKRYTEVVKYAFVAISQVNLGRSCGRCRTGNHMIPMENSHDNMKDKHFGSCNPWGRNLRVPASVCRTIEIFDDQSSILIQIL